MMNEFLKKLRSPSKGVARRKWILVLEDQLSDEIGPLGQEDPHDLGIVLIESHWKARRRPYHKQKIAFHLLNLRQFALEQAERGIAVRYLTTSQPFRNTLDPLFQELGPLRVMEPAELEVRQDLEPLIKEGAITVMPHEGWLTTQNDFWEGAGKTGPWHMDTFYRYVRKKTGILMNGKQPLGGKYSFDSENRKPWKGVPPAPNNLCFPLDPLKEEVVRFVESRFKDHPGRVHPEFLPGTKHDALQQWNWAKKKCLPNFGPYEDAMAQENQGLFHTRISALINIQRLLPLQIVKDLEALEVPLPSQEGFIRQVLGWREFVRHVHRETDGFRQKYSIAPKPGDAGYTKWGNHKWKSSKNPPGLDGGARPSFFGDEDPLPAAFWGAASGLNCLDQVVSQVWQEAYSHHITRLMVLSNIATLLGVSPRELTDWFWVAYTDAFDWVVEPNVLAMGTYGTGPLMTTKPYVSGAAYINRMSNYCDYCVFDPKKNCPITNLYWAFLDRHHQHLKDNPRLRLPLASLRKRTRTQRRIDAEVFNAVRATFRHGKTVTPTLLHSPSQSTPLG